MLTLPRFFAATVGVLAVLAGWVLTLAVRTAGEAVVQIGESARADRAARVAKDVEGELGAGERAIADFEEGLDAGIIAPPFSETELQRALTGALISLHAVTDLTLTSAAWRGYDEDGAGLLTPAPRHQLCVYRDAHGVLQRRAITAAAGDPADPTRHDTFRAAAHRDNRGRAIWSDIAFSELDAGLPEAQRRKTLTVQKAIFTRDGAFVGVLRAGIVSGTLDRMGLERTPGDPHRIFIADGAGRLITRVAPDDSYQVVDGNGRPDADGDLRVRPADLPPSIAAALAFARGGGTGGTRLGVAGVPHLATVLPVAPGRAQDWRVGIVVPESVYVGALTRARDRLLLLLVAIVAVIAAVGWLGARTIGRGVATLIRSTEAMRRFQFEAAVVTSPSPFFEVRGALESVERAKTALRAMVKYVPIGLVRRLYEDGHEPSLGAELTEVSLMFTDIADFTTHAETLTPARLAEALGQYLAAATAAVEATGGMVDKYIGDALMVLWNVPSPVAQHPVAACRAALACAVATRALGRSPAWRAAGLPPWHTRFGLHVDRVLVGNFGAPDRLSYTAMGDGVNLAARLEGLNKVYGTTILASEELCARAGDGFIWRQVDRVAVKGKTRAVAVYELVGLAGDDAAEARRPALADYETALQAVFA
ncbi:MAG TPA: adenylate/guanylate cyclase domain-containing protein, partial [Polyangia bacterium]|nr:adenylate/guanylate cyclase domain-containing protein [Polyangia bacterium]